VIPNGRFVTPAGVEVSVGAPKPFGMALSPDGKTVATVNSGVGPFSVTLVRNLATTPIATLINVNATFMGVAFSSDSSRFYAAGGENGNIWVGDTAAGKIIGSVNLNGPTHPLFAPLDVTTDPPGRFEGVFAGALAYDGRYLYVVDQAGFQVHIVDTNKIVTGTDPMSRVAEPNNFAAVVGQVNVGLKRAGWSTNGFTARAGRTPRFLWLKTILRTATTTLMVIDPSLSRSARG
jgi:DNA-binding beta-propeller fold protein YncE